MKDYGAYTDTVRCDIVECLWNKLNFAFSKEGEGVCTRQYLKLKKDNESKLTCVFKEVK